VITDPSRQWISVDEFPIHHLRGFLHDGLADRVPTFNDLVYVFELAGEGPRLFDIGFVLTFGNTNQTLG
jgi:hypothetical protein